MGQTASRNIYSEQELDHLRSLFSDGKIAARLSPGLHQAYLTLDKSRNIPNLDEFAEKANLICSSSIVEKTRCCACYAGTVEEFISELYSLYLDAAPDLVPAYFCWIQDQSHCGLVKCMLTIPANYDDPKVSCYRNPPALLAASWHVQKMWNRLFTSIFWPSRIFIPERVKSKGDRSSCIDMDLHFLLDSHLESIGIKDRLWQLAYSSQLHGKNWTSLTKKMTFAKSTVLVLRDSNGGVFGGFASVPWFKSPNFFGDSRCFLFRKDGQQMGLYRSSHINDNYLYFNSGMQSFPNGIGFGGQLEYFGLWIDLSLDIGHSRAAPLSTTYASPYLSRQENFLVDIGFYLLS